MLKLEMRRYLGFTVNHPTTLTKIFLTTQIFKRSWARYVDPMAPPGKTNLRTISSNFHGRRISPSLIISFAPSHKLAGVP